MMIAQTGVSGSELNRATPILARLARLMRDCDMTLAEINPLARLEDGSFVALDAHMEMENEAKPRQGALLEELGIGEQDTREPYEPSEFERNVQAIDSADHRGVIQGKDHGFAGNLGLVIGAGGGSLTLTDAVRSQGGNPANYTEIGGNPSVAKACGLAKEVLRRRAKAQDVFPAPVRALMGEMAAAASLMQANIKFNGALVLQMFGDGPVKVAVAEVQPDLAFRVTAKVVGDVADDATLASMLNVHGKGRCAITLDPKDKQPGQQPYQGVVPLHGDLREPLHRLSEVLEHYMLQSEQLDTKLILAANDEVANVKWSPLMRSVVHAGVPVGVTIA